MYETFTLRTLPKGIIQGYSWTVEDPERVVCVVHGIGEYGGRYERVAGKLNEAGCSVLTMDLRGHGDSVERKGHCAFRDDVLEDVSALLSYAARHNEGKPVILYGHSMGGNIALDYRSRGTFNDLPAAYLISAPWIRLVRPIPFPLYVTVKTMARLFPSMTIGASVNEDHLGNLELVRPYHDDPMVHNRISLQCAVDGFETGRKLEEGTLEDNGNAKAIPTLIMHGGEDRICDIRGTKAVVERMIARGDAVEFKEWPGLYHEIHNGGAESNGDEVIEEMIRFFKQF